MSIGAFHTLISNAGTFFFKGICHGKTGFQSLSMADQQAILQLAADGHDLGKQLIYTFFIKIISCHGSNCF